MKRYKKGFFTAVCLLTMIVISAGCSTKAAEVDEDLLGVSQSDMDKDDHHHLQFQTGSFRCRRSGALS